MADSFSDERAAEKNPSEHKQLDSGLLSLLMMAQYHGLPADPAKLQHEYGQAPFDSTTLLHAAKTLGFSSKCIRQPPERLHKAPLPCIAIDTEGRFFILAKIEAAVSNANPKPAVPGQSEPITEQEDAQQAARILIQRPGESPSVLARTDFMALWSGELILLTSKASFAGEIARFDFTWFIPAVVKYRKLLGEILVVSFVLQLVGLVTPLFFQVVMDKVLVNHALQTLNVIAIGLLCAIIFEVLLTGIRTYVFAHTSSKIDVELGARLFRHLMALPMAYFQARRVGDSVARVRELENIRSFLTGNGMTLVLD
ncbi:MAG: type I secretion system permease/ATPase, partial [Burkholderiales bacterium]|nr:type I secretion system permease/ATPase [Burkholderiales bacterium]